MVVEVLGATVVDVELVVLVHWSSMKMCWTLAAVADRLSSLWALPTSIPLKVTRFEECR